MAIRLTWKGNEVSTKVKREVMGPALGEIGLRVEAAAKRQLVKGHGVKTGTLRRSIHTAAPGYAWQRDDVAPSNSTPERGGQQALPGMERDGLVVQVGSGLKYALAVHQGFGSFEGYHFLTTGAAEVKPQVPSIVKKYALKQ